MCAPLSGACSMLCHMTIRNDFLAEVTGDYVLVCAGGRHVELTLAEASELFEVLQDVIGGGGVDYPQPRHTTAH